MNLSLQWLISFRRMPEDSHSRIQAQESLFRRLERFHGISAALASERLHALKEHFGRRADENVLFDLTGNVYDPNTLEWLGSLTQGGAK